jgi:cytochrome c-type biogenesis protein CcmH/NrfG
MPGAFASQPRSRLSTAPRGRARTERSLLSRKPGTAARVRWDRLGRLAMLFVLVALLYLYLSAGFHMYSTWGQARKDSASVVALEHEHTRLVRQHEALGRQGTVESEARKLGMRKEGEQQYVVTNLPNN